MTKTAAEKAAEAIPPKPEAAPEPRVEADQPFTFQPAGELAAPVVEAAPETDEPADDGMAWTDELNRRGRVISATREGEDSTLTCEEVLSPGAEAADVAKARARILKRMTPA